MPAIIKDERKSKVTTFEALKLGDYFLCSVGSEELLLLKIANVEDPEDGYIFNTIEVNTGCLTDTEDDTKVLPVSIEISIVN